MAARRNPHLKCRALLAASIESPLSLIHLKESDLDLTLRLSRRAQLLARLCEDLEAGRVLDKLPAVAVDQLRGFKAIAESRRRVTLWELNRIEWALKDRESDFSPVVALKGCAYLLRETRNARGRILADVDLLVPSEHLEPLEQLLNGYGWRSAELTPYDQNYYRKWTHELPPLRHLEREVEVDLHHNILPGTARFRPDANRLLAAASPVPESVYHLLSAEDTVLHAVAHLFVSDDLADKVRELVDICDLIKEFASKDEGFWQRLTDRAEQLGLGRPAYYAVRYAHTHLNLSVPATVFADLETWRPVPPVLWVMDHLVPRALFPPHPDYPSAWTSFCRFLLFVRSHWIRMPPWLLLYHLSNKFYLIHVRRIRRNRMSAGQP